MGRRVWTAVAGGVIGWSGWVLFGDLSGRLPLLMAVGLAVLYLAACSALMLLGLRLSRWQTGRNTHRLT